MSDPLHDIWRINSLQGIEPFLNGEKRKRNTRFVVSLRKRIMQSDMGRPELLKPLEGNE